MGGLESSGSSQDVVTSNGDVQRTPQARAEELFGDCDGTESVDVELFGDCGSQ